MLRRSPTIEDYLRARDHYRPEEVKVLWIAESPPTASGSYFYFPTTTGHDHLFRETMRSLGMWPLSERMPKNLTKPPLLDKFKNAGFLLIDTCATPVDKLPVQARKARVLDGASKISDTVQMLDPKKIIIVKSNVYGPVSLALQRAGYKARILNRTALPFPSHGWQQQYRDRVARMIRRAGFHEQNVLSQK